MVTNKTYTLTKNYKKNTFKFVQESAQFSKQNRISTKHIHIDF